MSSTALPFETSGDLAATPLPHLLLGLYSAGFDGVVCLDAPQRSKRLTFHKGAPVQASSNLKSETLGLQLVEQGLLSTADHTKVCAYIKQKECREGVALLALELIKPKVLFAALKEQVRRRIRECFAWPGGRYEIEPGEPPGDEHIAFRGDPLSIAQGGLESHWTVERIFADLGPHLAHFPIATPKLARHHARLEPDPALDALVSGVDGQTQFEKLIGPAFSSPRALAGVWVLAHSGAVEWSEAPAEREGDGDPDFEAEVELEVMGAGAGAGASSKAGAKPSPRKARSERAGDDEKAKAARDEIEQRRATLGQSDHYALLGVEPNAKAIAIKKAYFKAAKQYHPDTLVKLGLEDLRDAAAEVFARIAGAFEVLSDERKRKDYDASLRGELTEQQAAKLAQAETSFRKGEILLRMGDFKGALEYLRPAVEIWPEEAAYQGALGWALYKRVPSDPEQARAHLEHAMRLSSDDAVTHFRLGTVLRSLGEDEKAKRLLDRARQLEPKKG